MGTGYLCGLNMGLGNSKGTRKTNDRYTEKKSKGENEQKVVTLGSPLGKYKAVTTWLSSELYHDTVTIIVKARTYGVKGLPSPSKEDMLIQKYRVQLSDERSCP